MLDSKTTNNHIYLAIYSSIFMSVGLFAGSTGPIIPYLANQRNIPETQFSFLFIARAIGSLAGFFLIKYILGKQYQFIQHKMIIVGSTAIAIFSVIFVIYDSNIWTGISMAVFEGSHYGILTATNICVMFIAQNKAGQWITFVNAIFGLGALVSSLIIRQFETKAYYFYSACYLLVAISCIFYSTPTNLKKDSQQNTAVKKTQQFKEASIKIEILIGLGLFLTSGIESTISGWMPTYSINIGVFDKKQATICGTLFWTSSTIFRFVSAFITIKNSQKLKILLTSILCCTACGIILHHLQLFYPLVVVGSICFGLSCSAVYPLLLSISTEYRVKLRPNQLSNMMMAPAFASLLLAGPTGKLLQWNMNMLFYCLLIISGLLQLCSAFLFNQLQKHSKQKLPELQSQQLTSLSDK